MWCQLQDLYKLSSWPRKMVVQPNASFATLCSHFLVLWLAIIASYIASYTHQNAIPFNSPFKPCKWCTEWCVVPFIFWLFRAPSRDSIFPFKWCRQSSLYCYGTCNGARRLASLGHLSSCPKLPPFQMVYQMLPSN
jgi:hypothetical protein